MGRGSFLDKFITYSIVRLRSLMRGSNFVPTPSSKNIWPKASVILKHLTNSLPRIQNMQIMISWPHYRQPNRQPILTCETRNIECWNLENSPHAAERLLTLSGPAIKDRKWKRRGSERLTASPVLSIPTGASSTAPGVKTASYLLAISSHTGLSLAHPSYASSCAFLVSFVWFSTWP
jgi:hypothetical protein